MKPAKNKQWRQGWGFRRFDRWIDLPAKTRPIPPLPFGRRYFISNGKLALMRRYGFEFVTDQVRRNQLRLVVPPKLSDDRLVRFADHVGRTSSLKSLNRLAGSIRRQFALPSRRGHKSK